MITGAASGIGEALARQLCNEGAIVYASDLQGERLQQVSQGWSGKFQVEAIDVRSRENLQSWISCCESEVGRIDVFINNAGLGMAGPFEQHPWEDWELIRSINLDAVVWNCQQIWPKLKAQGEGHLVNLASLYAISPSPLASLYGCTKHAVLGLSRALMMEAEGTRVGIHAVCPGFVDTRIYEDALMRDLELGQVKKMIPFKSISPDQAAKIILKGVRKGKTEIVFPAHAKITRWSWRLAPGLFRAFYRARLRLRNS